MRRNGLHSISSVLVSLLLAVEAQGTNRGLVFLSTLKMSRETRRDDVIIMLLLNSVAMHKLLDPTKSQRPKAVMPELFLEAGEVCTSMSNDIGRGLTLRALGSLNKR